MEPVYDERELVCTVVSTEEFSKLESPSGPIATYLEGLSTDQLDYESRSKNVPELQEICSRDLKPTPSGSR